MSGFKRFARVFVVVFVLTQLAQFSALSAGSDKSLLLVEGVGILEKNFVGPVNVDVLLGGAKKALLKEIREDPILRTKPSLTNDVIRATDISSLRAVYRECVRMLGGYDRGSHLIYAMMRRMANSLRDPHTRFFSPEEADQFFGSMKERVIGGIGIVMSEHKSKFVIIDEVIENTPAFHGGLLAKDLITAIDGVSTRGVGIQNVSERIRGAVDSRVRLTVVRRGGDPFDVVLVRKPIRVGSVGSAVINKVGYIKLRYFGEDTNRDLDACFAKFDAANVKAYVLDVRDNGGGYLNVAVHTVSKFLPRGKIVVSFAGRAFPTEIHFTDGSQARDLPTIVLINEKSASASEIVAGALQDHGCKIVGVKSYGKGSVQQMHLLSDGSMLKVTLARWFTPLRRPVDKIGITPNVIVTQDEDSYEDTQLKRALEEAVR